MSGTNTNQGADASPERVERESLMHRQRSADPSRSTHRSHVTLQLGIRIRRQSSYLGSSSAALLLLLLLALCLYAFYQYGADVPGVLGRAEPIVAPEAGRSAQVQQILDAAVQSPAHISGSGGQAQ